LVIGYPRLLQLAERPAPGQDGASRRCDAARYADGEDEETDTAHPDKWSRAFATVTVTFTLYVEQEAAS
jgi:hypothetical protein